MGFYEVRTELRGTVNSGEPDDAVRGAVLRLLAVSEDGEPIPTLAGLRADVLLVGAGEDPGEAADARSAELLEVHGLAFGSADPLDSAVAGATGEFVPLGNLALVLELTGTPPQRALLLSELLEVHGLAAAFAPTELAAGLHPHAVLGGWAVWHASLRRDELGALAAGA